MNTIDETSSRKEIVNWLRGENKNTLIAIAVLINRLTDELQISLSLSKEGFLAAFARTDRDDLWSATDQVCADADPCDDDAEDDEEEDEDELEAT